MDYVQELGGTRYTSRLARPARPLTGEVWFRGYVQTYLERDLQNLAAIDNLVDFVIESAGRLLPIEVKATRAPGPRDVRHIRTFPDQYPNEFAGGLLLHDGTEVAWLAERVLAAPWWQVL